MNSELKPHRGVLENWTEEHFGTKGYIIWGVFAGHPKFDGKYGHTSQVIYREGNHIETRNSNYTLGEPYADTKGKMGSDGKGCTC